MSMSTHIYGIRDLEARFAKMIKIKLACEDASVDYPQDLKDYFTYPTETEEYLRKEMEEVDLKDVIQRSKGEFSSEDIITLDLNKLPDDIKFVRVINSY